MPASVGLSWHIGNFQLPSKDDHMVIERQVITLAEQLCDDTMCVASVTLKIRPIMSDRTREKMLEFRYKIVSTLKKVIDILLYLCVEIKL